MSKETIAPVDEAVAAPSLDPADIQNAVAVIDYAAEQGAFRGWGTIEKVLLVRNRLNTFVGAVAALQPPAPEGSDSAEGSAAEATADSDNYQGA